MEKKKKGKTKNKNKEKNIYIPQQFVCIWMRATFIYLFLLVFHLSIYFFGKGGGGRAGGRGV
jgi:hypothetical protein